MNLSIHRIKNIKFFGNIDHLSACCYALTIEIESKETFFHISLFSDSKEVLEKIQIKE